MRPENLPLEERLKVAAAASRPASADGWRRVLDGSVMAPSQPARRTQAPSPVRVVYGWFAVGCSRTETPSAAASSKKRFGDISGGAGKV
jgi:hypothetical protein